ncbi:hypothetical protein JMK10_06695 [Rhodovulum sulfidophilum]|uniref:hypothetical protein n=1 Tax=Rhodovulum sulfidophilum TaxID=35806 RepID=UPI001924A34C|nr:hypothetical protein [Rhodovulum sulfidophilum]MBL3572419.1 hypothetical protein [Rhodovulum sulfidophilum]MCE8432794.1 hypothetical protein [Rhodovulum sulfidophilum]MCF4116496.1 hypothetical protein [Rhodovulum sulfidophilum]
MKTLALTAAAFVALSAPVFAQTQLEQDLGVQPGSYSASQLIELKAAAEKDGPLSRVWFSPASSTTMSTSGYANARVAKIVASLAAESDNGYVAAHGHRDNGPAAQTITDPRVAAIAAYNAANAD